MIPTRTITNHHWKNINSSNVLPSCFLSAISLECTGSWRPSFLSPSSFRCHRSKVMLLYHKCGTRKKIFRYFYNFLGRGVNKLILQITQKKNLFYDNVSERIWFKFLFLHLVCLSSWSFQWIPVGRRAVQQWCSYNFMHLVFLVMYKN